MRNVSSLLTLSLEAASACCNLELKLAHLLPIILMDRVPISVKLHASVEAALRELIDENGGGPGVCVYESGTRKRARMTTKRLVGDRRRQSCKLQNEPVWALAVPLNVH
jgi:hypothetical protein